MLHTCVMISVISTAEIALWLLRVGASSAESHLFPQDHSAQFELNSNELEAAKVAARRVSKLEADSLEKKCEEEVCAAVRATFSEDFEPMLVKMRDFIASGVDRDKVRKDLKNLVEQARLDRIKYSFNKMSQGKTKVCQIEK